MHNLVGGSSYNLFLNFLSVNALAQSGEYRSPIQSLAFSLQGQFQTFPLGALHTALEKLATFHSSLHISPIGLRRWVLTSTET